MRRRSNAWRVLSVTLSLLMCVSILICSQTAFAEEHVTGESVEAVQEVSTEEETAPEIKEEKNQEAEKSETDKTSDEEEPSSSEDIFSEKESVTEEGSSALPDENKPLDNQLLKASALRAEQSNVITKIEALLQDGSGSVGETITQWQIFRIKAFFELPEGAVKSGDTTTIKLPDKLRFDQIVPFEVKTPAGDVVANAVVDGANKTLTLTYTDYPETHSEVTGNFFFYVRMDRSKVDGEEDIPLDFVINNQVISAGTVHFVGYPTPQGGIIGKSGTQESTVEGSRAWFNVNINTKGEDLKDVSVIDTLQSKGITIDKSTFKIRKGRWEAIKGDFIFQDDTDVTNQYAVNWNSDDSGFSVSLGDVGSNEGYRITYYVDADYELVDGERIDNNVILHGKDIGEQGWDARITWAIAGGSAEGYVYKIRIKKVDKDDKEKALAGAVFEVKRVANGDVVGTITTDAGGEGDLGGLLKDSYELTEISAPPGYELLNKPISVSTDDFNSDKIAFKTIENETETIDIPAVKYWVGPMADEAVIKLYIREGNSLQDTGKTLTLNEGNSWKGSFEKLKKYNGEGMPIDYVLEEEPIDGYTTAQEKDEEGTHIFTNTNMETINIPVNKQWVGAPLDSVQIKLIADGSVVETVELNSENGWKHTFEELPLYDKDDGHKIKYDVQEGDTPGYGQNRSGSVENGFTFTNTITGKVSVPVTKRWTGPAAENVTVNLLADNVKVKEAVLSADNNWQYTFTDLDKYKDGKEIEYTVMEEHIENYDSKVEGNATDGYTVTNTNTEKISIPVEKKWVGDPLDRIVIKLLADKKEVDSVTLTKDTGWKGTFTGLPKYDSGDGHEIDYNVKEDEAGGYISGKSGTAAEGFTVTNTITGKVSVPVTKVWEGPKADSVTIELYADGAKADEAVLNSANGWQYTFENLEKYKDGKEISYEVREPEMKNYKTEISGNARDGYIVKNINTEVRSVDVTKKWIGDPAKEVTIHLYADGTEIDSAKITAASNWNHSFKELPVYAKDGHRISYTVSEDALKGYTSKITGDDEKGFTVTNTKDIPPKKDTPKKDTPGPKDKEKVTKNSPKTGDSSSVAGYAFVLLASASILAALAFRRRKKNG